MTDARTFGTWLQRERERREITLRAIADRTKIGAGLLQSLERGDVSRWPGGIYRRSFVRSYAEAIGVDPELVLANFERLFPDPDALSGFERSEPALTMPRASADTGAMRLQFASPVWPGAAAMRTAGLDVLLAVCVGTIGYFVAGATGFWCAMALAALACHVCTVLGVRWAIRTPVASALLHWKSRRAQAREMVAELAEYPETQADPALDLTYFAR